MVVAHRAGLRIDEVPVQMRERQGGRSSITPMRSAYYMVKVLMAVAMLLLRRPVKLPEGALTRIILVSLIVASALLLRRARAGAPTAPAGALLGALARHVPDRRSCSPPGPPCSLDRHAVGIAYPPNALFVVAFGFLLRCCSTSRSWSRASASRHPARPAARDARGARRARSSRGRSRVARRAPTRRWRATGRRSGRPGRRRRAARCRRGRAPSARARRGRRRSCRRGSPRHRRAR